ARALDGLGNLRLMPGARARDAPRHDLAAVRDEARQAAVIFVVDPFHRVEAELAELPSKRTRFAVACHETSSSVSVVPRGPTLFSDRRRHRRSLLAFLARLGLFLRALLRSDHGQVPEHALVQPEAAVHLRDQRGRALVLYVHVRTVAAL